jgi:hypothetical protein
VLAVLGLLLALLVVVGLRKAVRSRSGAVRSFPYSRPVLTAEGWAALAAKPGWRAETVAVADGVVLRGLVRAPRAPGAPWVLFFQGNSKRLLGEGQEVLEALAGQDDLGLALFAWRGFDGSTGEPTKAGFTADALAALRWLQAHRAGDGPLHLLGFSLGTLPAVAAALEGAGEPAARPRSLTLLAPFTVLEMHDAGPLRQKQNAEEWRLLPLVGGLKLPTLVVHGTDDQTLPIEMGRAIAQAIPGAKLVEVPGQGHVPVMLDPRALAAVRAVVLGKE